MQKFFHEKASENTVCEMVAILSCGDELYEMWMLLFSLRAILFESESKQPAKHHTTEGYKFLFIWNNSALKGLSRDRRALKGGQTYHLIYLDLEFSETIGWMSER